MTKKPTVASLKKVSPENLARLGAERLAEILADVAEARPELKRRLRMELAAEQGPEHLTAEIDRRLGTLETSRSKVSWRQRPAFVRDLDGLRALIAGRLAGQAPEAALERLWQFLALARRTGGRTRDKHGELAAVFLQAAADVGALAGRVPGAAARLVQALADEPARWAGWLPLLLAEAPPGFAADALKAAQGQAPSGAAWTTLVRQLADAAGDAGAYLKSYPKEALLIPSVAADVARRLLDAGRTQEAGRLLEAAGAHQMKPVTRLIGGRRTEPDFAWEGVLIDYLEQAGKGEEAQAARWASFERTLSAARARDYTRRLPEFEDVEAESRAFDIAAAHAEFERGLTFLMDWPALPEAARMIEARADEIALPPELTERWAAKLRIRQPGAALILLRKGAAAALKRRDFQGAEAFTQEADAIGGG